MVCAKCQKLQKKTELATPGVKRRNEMYYGSPASSMTSAGDKSKKSPTAGVAGIGKSKLLSKSAKNPYGAYSSSCATCKTKTDPGRKFCHSCAYKANACAMCGRSQSKEASTGKIPIVQGQRFSAK